MELRRPATDAPPWATVAAVGTVCFAIGLGLAFWGTDRAADSGEDTHAASSLEDAEIAAMEGPPSQPDRGETAREPTDVEDASAPSETDSPEPADPLETDSPPADPGGAQEGEEATGGPIEASSDSASNPQAPLDTPTRFVRGRVAYLRCDGAARGGRCPRDEPLEGAVWEVLGRLTECAVPGAGQGDLRIAWEGDDAADVLWRDTFADDVVRLDRDAVLGCVEAALADTRASDTTVRLLVSFRFRME